MSYIGNLCQKLVTKLNLEKRIVSRRDNEPYLTRYYIFRKPVSWMPSIYLHCFHSSDEDSELHNHPWNHSLSLILSGSYLEEYKDNKGSFVRTRILKPGRFNHVAKNKFHRVDLLSKDVWTLFISGSKVQDWGFWNRETNEFVQWEEHERRKNRIKDFNSFKVNSLVEKQLN